MEKNERLLPLPSKTEIQTVNQEYPASYSPFYDDESFENKRTIREYLNVVYKRLPLILALTILTTAAAALYMYKQPSQFTAVTQIMIEPRKPPQTSKDTTIINFGNDANYYNTQLLLLQNTDLMRDVVIRLGLYRDPNLINSQNRSLLASARSIFSGEEVNISKETSLPNLTQTSTDSSVSEVAPLTPEEQKRAEIYAFTLIRGLSVNQVEDTSLVDVAITSTNPDLAAKVANKTADVFIERNAKSETKGAEKDLEDLSKSIEELKGTIASQQQQLISYMQDGNIPLADKGQDLSASRLQEISTQWLAATEERRKIEAKYNAAQQANARGEGVNIPDLTEQRIFQEKMRINAERKAKLQEFLRGVDKQISDAETERSQLLVKYTDEHPKVKQVDAQIEKLKETRSKNEIEITETIDKDQTKLEQEGIKGALVGLKSQLEAALKKEAQWQDTYNKETSIANYTGINQTKLTTLKREIDTNRQLLDTYIQRQSEQQLALSSSRPNNIRVASEAQTPNSPVGPNRTRNILIAFLFSLASGIGLAFLMDYLDDSIRTSDDIGRYLGLPTLALIPHQNNSDKRKLALAPTKNGNGTAPSMALIALEDKRSAMAEAYRHLRTSLLFSSAGKPPQTMLVTSSQPSEGKTTTAINTAITLAQSGADVVLIDCDLRRPRLHNHFNLTNTTGLTNYLSGEKNTENLVKPFPNLPKLKVITSGPIPPNPAELLSSNEMKNLLQFLRGQYQHVVIDSPPAISFTDAAILSTLVDGVILVAMAGKSSIHLMRRFKHRLANIGARVYGVVLNGITADSVEYGYYGYGYTYNYYEANDDDSTPRMEEWDDILSLEENQKK